MLPRECLGEVSPERVYVYAKTGDRERLEELLQQKNGLLLEAVAHSLAEFVSKEELLTILFEHEPPRGYLLHGVLCLNKGGWLHPLMEYLVQLSTRERISSLDAREQEIGLTKTLVKALALFEENAIPSAKELLADKAKPIDARYAAAWILKLLKPWADQKVDQQLLSVALDQAEPEELRVRCLQGVHDWEGHVPGKDIKRLALDRNPRICLAFIEALLEFEDIPSAARKALKKRMENRKADFTTRIESASLLAEQGVKGSWDFLVGNAMDRELGDEKRMQTLVAMDLATRDESFTRVLFSLVFAKNETPEFKERLLNWCHYVEDLSEAQEKQILTAVYQDSNPLWFRLGLIRWLALDEELYDLLLDTSQPEVLRFQVLEGLRDQETVIGIEQAWELLNCNQSSNRMRQAVFHLLQTSAYYDPESTKELVGDVLGFVDKQTEPAIAFMALECATEIARDRDPSDRGLVGRKILENLPVLITIDQGPQRVGKWLAWLHEPELDTAFMGLLSDSQLPMELKESLLGSFHSEDGLTEAWITTLLEIMESLPSVSLVEAALGALKASAPEVISSRWESFYATFSSSFPLLYSLAAVAKPEDVTHLLLSPDVSKQVFALWTFLHTTRPPSLDNLTTLKEETNWRYVAFLCQEIGRLVLSSLAGLERFLFPV